MLKSKLERFYVAVDAARETLAGLRAAIRCRARLRGITEAAARAELIAIGDIPVHRGAASCQKGATACSLSTTGQHWKT